AGRRSGTPRNSPTTPTARSRSPARTTWWPGTAPGRRSCGRERSPGRTTGSPGLTYWVRRAARGGRVALPGDPAQPVQIVDSRDLACLVVQLLTDDRPGAFHAVGPATPVTLGGLVETCARVAGARVDIVPVPLDTAP